VALGFFNLGTEKSVDIRDIRGRQVLAKREFTAGKLCLTRSSFAAGIYVVRARSAGRCATAKFIME
jgi:hypothetical protein